MDNSETENTDYIKDKSEIIRFAKEWLSEAKDLLEKDLQVRRRAISRNNLDKKSGLSNARDMLCRDHSKLSDDEIMTVLALVYNHAFAIKLTEVSKNKDSTDTD